MTNDTSTPVAPPDDPRLAEIREKVFGDVDAACLSLPELAAQVTHTFALRDADMRYLIDQLDAARATIAGVKRAFEDLDGLDLVEPHLAQYACDLCERLRDSAERNDRQALRLYNLESQLAAAREDVQKEKQRADRAVGWLASAYHWTDLIDPENCPADSDVYAEAAKLLNKAREDATLIEALAAVMGESEVAQLSTHLFADGHRNVAVTDRRGVWRASVTVDREDNTPAAALRAALASLRDRTPETTNG